ncbi:MAG: GAF domain-containing protein [Candidatus Aminicenantes bacterium]|nr:GAF domain-containing protein [Candidatus Aminicenantes bacterium]
MKYSNNKIFIFSPEKEVVNLVSKILKKEYPEKKKNLIALSHELPDAVDKLTTHYNDRIYFDIFLLDLKIPLPVRNEFMKTVNRNQVDYECIIASNTSALEDDEIEFIKSINAYIIPDISEITLFPLIQNVIQKKFNERKYLLVNRIDNIINSEIEGKRALNHILNLTLEYLDLRTCWISLVDYRTKTFKIGALTGFGEHEKEFRANFNVSLLERSVISECVTSKEQVQYKNILDSDCPFKDKNLAKKMGLKSFLVTPIFDRRGITFKKVLATLNLYTKFYHEFLEDELELTKIIAAKITAALFTKGLYQTESRGS